MKWQTVTLFQQKPPRKEDNEDGDKKGDDALAAAGFDEDEAALEHGPPELRYTMKEFNEMYEARQAKEIKVFTGALLRLDKHSSKNAYMNKFIVHLFRNVETTYITS